MKKIITSLAFIVLSAFAIAQENYTIKMNVKVEGMPPEMAGFGDQDIITYVKGDKNKTEITSMMGNQTVFFDGKIHTVLVEAMGNKSGYTATKEEMEEANKRSGSADNKPKIEYTTEKKMIAGYECTKAIVTTAGINKDAKENKITVWVTDKIISNTAKGKKSNGAMSVDLGDLKGYPLQMEMAQSMQGMDMKISVTTSEVTTKPIDETVFKVNTEGYKMSTFKEYSEKMKAYQAPH